MHQVLALKKLVFYDDTTHTFHRPSDHELADAADRVRERPTISVQDLMNEVMRHQDNQPIIERI